MVKILNLVAVITAALCGSDIANAHRCHVGGIYCGRYLIALDLKKEHYDKKITVNLEGTGHNATFYNKENSLWTCIKKGDIQFLQICDYGCRGGDIDDDYCYQKFTTNSRKASKSTPAAVAGPSAAAVGLNRRRIRSATNVV